MAGWQNRGRKPVVLPPSTVPAAAPVPVATADAGVLVDRAWKLLDTNQAAIDRADAKAGVIVAACGVSAAALVAVYGAHHADTAAVASALACAVLASASTSCAGIALRPRRMRAKRRLDSLIYFDHVARLADSSVDNYLQAASLLISDAEALTEEIFRQVWATARLATIKYDWIDRAVALLFGNIFALAVTTLLLAK